MTSQPAPQGRSSEDRYRLLVEKAPIGVFEIGDGVLIYINEFLESLSGYSKAEIVGRTPEDIVIPEDRERLAATLGDRLDGQSSDPQIYRFVGKSGEIFVGEVQSQVIGVEGAPHIEGTIRDITYETRLNRFQKAILDLAEVILGEQDIDRILQLVLDTITEYSGFRRAVLSLYDLSIPVPFDGSIHKLLTSGLTQEEDAAIRAQEPLAVEDRKRIFADQYRLGAAYYVSHNEAPWSPDWGLAGTVSVAGWHQDDFLFVPLRGAAGIIGSISVDDPVDGNVPTVTSIQPVSSLANYAALAVERAYKLVQMRRQKERLHGLWGFGSELSEIGDVVTLCDVATRRVRDDMDYDYCAIWVVEGEQLVKLGLSTKSLVAAEGVAVKGTRVPVEGGGLTRHTLHFREPVIVPDVQTDPRFQGSRRGTRSFIGIPIYSRKRPLGVIVVESQTLAAFGDEDVEVLSALASQVSIAILALRRRDALQRIYAFGQRVAAASTVDQVISSTLDFMTEQFDFELGEVFLIDENGALVLSDVRGPYEHSGVVRGWTLPEGKGVIAWAVRNRRAALVEDVRDDPRYHEAFSETRSELAVPILTPSGPLGALNVESPIPAFFDLEDRQLLEAIANHLAIALSNLASQESLREQAVRDPLTDLYNRHYFNSLIGPELDRSDRYQHPLTLMMIDIDGFRAINNRFGHLKGDEVLKEVAIYLGENVRSSDRVIRYGGDEFLVFMPETDHEAPPVASRLCKRLPVVLRRAGIQDIEIGLSIGIYTRQPRDARSLESILEEVDRRMYADKRANNVHRADDYRR